MSKVKKLKVLIERENYIESVHYVNLYDVSTVTDDFVYPRSAVKPFQILPLLIEAHNQNIKFSSEEIAIFASSHSAEPMHTDLIQTLALKYDLNINNLLCGPQRPFHEKTADSLVQLNKEFISLHNNCSGKHLSMLLFSKLLGADSKNYTDRNHITQVKIDEFFKEIFNENELIYSIDGCGLPALKVNPQNLCLGVTKLKNSSYSQFWNEMFDAYNSYPELIGGSDRTDTNIINHSNNKVLAKSGAEGVLFFTNNYETYLFKCLDGNKRGVDLAATYFLNQIGLISNFPFQFLENFYSKNTQEIQNVKIKVK